MRYFYFLFCLLSFNAFGQNFEFQIELVDGNIGVSLTSPPEFYTNESNNEGLNQIFENFNVVSYETVYPGYGLVEPHNSDPTRFHVLNCESCDSEAFLTALNGYSSVVKYASPTTIEGVINNVLTVDLVSSSIGTFVGFDNNVVTTNDSGLNSIFENFNVRHFGALLPSTTNYSLVCSCDATSLKVELENYSSVIALVDYQTSNFLLSTEDLDIEMTEIYPNPFKNKITLNTNSVLQAIEVYDILGKQMLKTNNKLVFESRAINLKSGIYILRLTDVDGKIITKKLIKE